MNGGLCMHECMCVNGRMGGCVNALVVKWMDGGMCVDGWMNRWVNALVVKWIHGSIAG